MTEHKDTRSLYDQADQAAWVAANQAVNAIMQPLAADAGLPALTTWTVNTNTHVIGATLSGYESETGRVRSVVQAYADTWGGEVAETVTELDFVVAFIRTDVVVDGATVQISGLILRSRGESGE